MAANLTPPALRDAGVTTRFGILGPLEITAGSGPNLMIGGRKQRELLCLLILHRNRAVSASRLVAELWGDEAPKGAEVTLRSHVSHLRRRLAGVAAGESLSTSPAGYALRLAPGQLDADRFENGIGLGQEALGLGRWERAAAVIRDALGLWRGRPYADLDVVDAAVAESARLEEVRLAALEVLGSAELAAGRHRDLVAELESLTLAHPFRERFCGQLMVALYRSGRQAEALDAYARTREQLADQLGLDPGPELQDLAQRILQQDPLLLGETGPADYRPPDRVPAPSVSGMPDAVLTAEARIRLAGRTLERARLDATWQSVRSGGRNVVLLSGEAGIGKTRLVAELTVRVQSGGYPVLVGRCDSTPAAYHPIITWLRTSAHAAAVVAAAPQAIQAEVGRLLDEGPVDRADPRPPAPEGERALYSAVAFVVGRLAHPGPLLLIIDNAESIDRASSRLLNFLVERLPSGFLLVVSYRDPPGGRHPPLLDLLGELSALDHTVRLPLGPIGETDIADLVGDLLPAVDAGLAQRLWRHTGGNPFFVRELARSLADSADQVDPSVWRVPIGVRDVVRHRLRSSSPGVADVLPVAAALGTEVDVELLSQVLHLSEDEVGQALDEAATVGLLVESGHGWAGAFSFPHPLLRESLAAEVGGSRLRGLHLRAARALMSRPRPAGGRTAAVAGHLRAAGPAAEPIEAAEWSLRAAREAADLYAWDEAVEYAEAAVDWLAAVPPPTRQAEAAVSA
ncbi:MAG TPA: BTAD domain-containing putative transcriptional regulator, partial [Microlunatus sp.]|nr:BTAD domain-containing putative transcriptional regulator [Microlunatus sp.]